MKHEDPTFNRRKYPRVRTEALVSIARVDAPATGLANALDLSMSGLRFQCVGVEVEQGEMLRVALTLGEDTVTVVGQLVRVTELDAFTQEVALTFVDVDAETLEQLTAHLPDLESVWETD